MTPLAALALALAAAAPDAGQLAREAFPEAERVEPRELLLTDELAARLEALSHARVKERRVAFVAALKGPGAGLVVGWLVVHEHVVRTKRETLSIAFEPDGRIRKVRVIEFQEPPEYRTPERWLAQLEGKGPDDKVTVGQDLAPISGATLSARGVAEASRWLLQALKLAAHPPAGGRP
ncbi:MAG: FMN-binding protein [Anaeromyxobacter sp.]